MPAYNTNPPQFRNLGQTPKRDFSKARERLAAQKKQQGANSSLALNIPKQEPETVKQSFLSRFNQFMSKDRTPEAQQVWGNIKNDFTQGAKDLSIGKLAQELVAPGTAENINKNPFSGALQDVGTVAKTSFSIISRPLEPILMGVADKISDSKTVQNIASTDFVGERLADISFGMEKYGEWAKRNPELSRNIEAGANTALLLAGEKPAQQALKTAAETTTGGVNATLRGAAKVSETVGKGKTAITNLPTVGKDLIGKGRDLIKPPKDVAGVVGEITQAKNARDLARSQKALTELDTTGVETYTDLLARIKTGVKDLSQKVDDVMAKDTTTYKPQDLTIVARTEGGKIVKTDYVSRALRHLEEIYSKSGDDLLAANIREAITKYVKQGLTKLDINDLARVYGMDAPKGFSKMGDALTSFNAKASENIRSGLKEVARSGMDDTAKNLDAQITNLKTLEGYTLKMEEAVQGLTNKIEQRGLLEQAGRLLGNVADLTTGGFVKSFFSKFLVPSNVGQKVMNSLDLESRLAKNLQLIKQAESGTDKQLLEIVKELVKPADDVAPKAPVTQFEAPKVETRSSLERSPIITYIKNNPPNIGLSIRDVKAIDSLTKKEMVEIIDYARLKQPYSQALEDAMAYLAEKYNLKGKTPTQIADELEQLITTTKTSTLPKASTPKKETKKPSKKSKK